MPILECQDLHKTYGRGEGAVQALREITTGFEEGEICAVRGPSGSGKSTLLHILGGLEYPTSGKVLYRGEDLFAYNDNQLSILRRRRFGFVFQAYNLVQELTAYENILLPVLLDKKRPDKKYIEMLVEILGLGDRLNHLPSALSGGQQQRVAIARALANKPALLFADEPTGNLDGKSGQEVLALLKYVSKEMGLTLILVTHDLNVAEQAARIISLEDGIITQDSSDGSITLDRQGANNNTGIAEQSGSTIPPKISHLIHNNCKISGEVGTINDKEDAIIRDNIADATPPDQGRGA